MFSRKNSSNSAAVSRTTSLSDRGSLDMDRNTSSLQAVHLSTSGRRTMSLEEEDDEDDEMNPWERIRATSGPMSAVSETGSKMSLEAPTTQEVRALRVTNLRRGYTVNDIQRAFEMDPADQALSVEIQGPDSIIVHFADPDQAMRAYFAYLSSTSSIGTVTPWEPQSGKDESAPSSPRRPQNLQNQSSNRNRRSFQGQYGGSNNVLTALSSISAWRSSDKLSTMDKESRQSSFKSHGRTSSRSSLTSKSHDKIPSLLSMTNAQAVSSSSNAKTSAASSMRPASSPGTDNDNAFSSSTTTAIIPDTTTMAGASASTPDTQSGHSSPGLILQDQQQQQQQRRPPTTSGKTSTARRILSGFGSFGSGSSNNKKEKKPK